MKIETYAKGRFQVLRVTEGDDKISDLSELQDLIIGYLNRGKCQYRCQLRRCLVYLQRRYRVLVNCHRMISERGGELCIIEPTQASLTRLSSSTSTA